MRHFFSIGSIALLLNVFTVSSQEIPPKDWQIKTALLAVPEAHQEKAKVYGYNANGTFTTLREGSNMYIALADNPKDEKFSVSSYHKDLDEFMARGRELRAQGKEFQEVFDIREAEVKSGQLKMPDKAMLCILTGTVNAETQKIENSYKRYVFYIPFATGASTGLSTSPSPLGTPWLMDAGTHRAHIMITPKKD